MTRVATISFANAQDHGFEWLWEENGNAPIVDRSKFDNWHLWFMRTIKLVWMVYRWYIKMLSRLLQKCRKQQILMEIICWIHRWLFQ